MSKKNSKKRWHNQHQESMRREAEEAEKKAKRAAKMAEKAAEESGAMMTDGASAKIKAGRASKSSVAADALKVSRASLKTPPTKNTRKIIKGVRVGEVQKKLKLRKGATVRGIKIHKRRKQKQGARGAQGGGGVPHATRLSAETRDARAAHPARNHTGRVPSSHTTR